jgi:hypothetical protein
MGAEMVTSRIAAATAIALGLLGCVPGLAQQAADTTNLRVTNQVILAGVTRLGINLGDQDFYDSGQMLRNLISRNPEFAGMTYRSIVHCQIAGTSLCVDMRQGFQFPANFWNGASYEVLLGAAAGQRGSVSGSGADADGYAFALDSGGRAIGAGDWIVVEKNVPDDAGAGWWPAMHGGARLEIEHADVPPGVPVRQVLKIDAAGVGQSADLNAYFDSMAGRSFVHLRGRYRLSFRAKALSGSTTGSTAGVSTMHVHVGRLVAGLRRYLDTDVHLTSAWAQYSEEFTANETALPAAAVETGFHVSGGSVLLSDVALEQVGGDPSNHTVFRDEVVETLRELHPGVLRLMESRAGLGSTVENLLAAPAARQRSGYRTWFKPSDDVAVGIPEFLELCLETGAEPWIVAPTAMSLDETRKLAEYLAGQATTEGGALRAAAGRIEPWTQAFRTIHIELGNETWNSLFQGESMDHPAAYGQWANTVFTAFRAAAGADAGRFDLVIGTQAEYAGRNSALLAAAPQANSLAIAPYLMSGVTQWANDDELYGPLLAQPEQMSLEGFVHAATATAGGRQLAVYEVNLHTTGGDPPQSVLDRLAPSAAAGVAVAGHMLRMMRDHGIRDEALFSLPQYGFGRTDGKTVRLWGSVVEMGADGRKRPQFLAESLANRAIRGNLVKVEIAGKNPTHDQPPGNDGVSLRNVHEIDAYAFQDGKWHSLIVFNYGLHHARRISIEAAGLGRDANATLMRLVSASPGDTNEDTINVRIEEEHFAGSEMTLAPCSMAVLEWTE